MYIRQLNDQTMSKLLKDLRHVLQLEGLTDEQELSIAIGNAADSKISDLSDVLNVKEYIREDTVLRCLDYLQEMDSNGAWEEAEFYIWQGEPIQDEDITYMIDTLKEWLSELVNDEDKEAERKKKTMQGWIDRLEGVK